MIKYKVYDKITMGNDPLGHDIQPLLPIH